MSKPLGSQGFNRRQFLLGSSAAVLSTSFPQLSQSATHASLDRTLAFINLHTNEKLVSCYCKNGIYNTNALAEINYILRDHRSKEVYEIDTKLLDLLHTLHSQTNSASPFHIISGYRSPKTNASLRKNSSGVAKRSLHMQGRAIDVRLPDIKLVELRNTAIELQAGGVGYYTKSNFLHLDTGRPRNW